MIRAGGIHIVLLTDAPGNGPGPEEGGAMRGFHCVDPSHGRIEFTGANDEELLEQVKAHAAKAHPDLTESQLRDMVGGADWWQTMATSGVNSGSSPSAYDK
jgi:predicted small metal-binding protein